ncbi:MAG: DUF2384 domain-containing protein [Proteobacteria bacterium]|nr:DUF2384 domain-containing protein [Pseudomonadota bacterium]
MDEAIRHSGMDLINEYVDFISKEFERILAHDANVSGLRAAYVVPNLLGNGALQLRADSLGDSRLADGRGVDLAGLASQFIHALAAEASRLANEEGRSAGQPEVKLPLLGQTRSADLESSVIEDWAGRVAGATYLEGTLRIPRSTLHRWHRCNEVVALRKGRQRHVYPLAQFVDGRPASGIREVLQRIPNPRNAWFWMVQASPELNGRTPIELLRQDIVTEVVLAAEKYSEPRPI